MCRHNCEVANDQRRIHERRKKKKHSKFHSSFSVPQSPCPTYPDLQREPSSNSTLTTSARIPHFQNLSGKPTLQQTRLLSKGSDDSREIFRQTDFPFMWNRYDFACDSQCWRNAADKRSSTFYEAPNQGCTDAIESHLQSTLKFRPLQTILNVCYLEISLVKMSVTFSTKEPILPKKKKQEIFIWEEPKTILTIRPGLLYSLVLILSLLLVEASFTANLEMI